MILQLLLFLINNKCSFHTEYFKSHTIFCLISYQKQERLKFHSEKTKKYRRGSIYVSIITFCEDIYYFINIIFVCYVFSLYRIFVFFKGNSFIE